MAGNRLKWWFDAVCTILVPAGVVFASFGLDILPVERSVLLKWGSGIYRSLMMGWGTTLLLAGQVAFRKGDRELVRALACGVECLAACRGRVFHGLARVVQRWGRHDRAGPFPRYPKLEITEKHLMYHIWSVRA
jgi:hypothetical protein